MRNSDHSVRSRVLAAALSCAVAVLLALLAPRVSQAQATPAARADTGRAVTVAGDSLPRSLPGLTTSAAEIGGRAFSQSLTPQQLGKFNDYKDPRAGLVVQQLQMDYTPDNFRRVQLSASDVGLLDQSIGLHAKQPGLFDAQLTWDRIPHMFSTDARSLFTTVSPGVYKLPTPRPDTAAFNRAPFIDPVRSIWDPVRFAAVATPSQAWDFKAEYTRIGKRGDRPMGQAFGGSGNNANEILEPIDQTVHDFKLSQSYADERFQFVAAYDLSVFRNGVKSAASDNPLATVDSPTGGAAQGRTALAPNNLAHTVVVNGGLGLPFRTRVTANAALSWWRQNEAFIPVTSNTAISDPRIAQLPVSLGGNDRVDNIGASITSHPLTVLTLSGRYRSYAFRDNATTSVLPIIILNDRTVSPADTARRDPFTRQNADLAGSWQMLEPLSVSAGLAWEQMDRDTVQRSVLRTTERTPRIGADFTGFHWVSLHSTYSKGWRRGGTYVQPTSSENPGARRFDQADRDRERTSVMASVVPIDQVTLSGTWQVGHDLYPNSAYGVQSDRSTAVGGDLAVVVTNWLTAGVGVMRETFDDLMRARYRTGTQLTNLTFDWVGHNTDAATTTSVGLTATLIPDRLELGGTYELTRSRYAMGTSNPLTPTGGTAAQNASATAVDLPQVSQTLQPIGAYVRYRMGPDWAFTLSYHGELYTQTDYKTLGLSPATATSATNMYLFLANNFQNYDARYFTFSFAFYPQALRIRRSTL